MSNDLKISGEITGSLCCPICRSKLRQAGDSFECSNVRCRSLFPIVDGIPILINEDSSLFSIKDFLQRRSTFYQRGSKQIFVEKIKQFAKKLIPSINLSVTARGNCLRFSELILKQNQNPKVLIIGGSIVGKGLEVIISLSSIKFVETDISFGERTILICDAHDIPFDNGTFDGVILQAVLEHVIDPYRCVEEIHRVLKDDGLVYAETPFMMQVHAGRYDFLRFTHLGHRHLFKKFSEISSGALCGPGMALAWSYEYFLMSLVKSKPARKVMKAFAMLTSFWLKYFDYLLIRRPGALDAAAACYFLGRRSNNTLSGKEIIRLYRGAT